MKLVGNKDNQAVTTSLVIAKEFSKTHRDVMKSIRNLAAQNCAVGKMFVKGAYKNRQGHDQPMYYMNRDGFSLLAMGFTGKKAMEFKLEFIDQFNEMESEIKSKRAELPKSPQEITKQLLSNLNANNEDIQSLKTDVKDLRDNQHIDSGEYNYLSGRIPKKVYKYARHHGINAGQDKDKIKDLFRDINRQIKEVAGVRTRTQLKAKDYESVNQLIDDWEPTTATRIKINQTTLDLGDGNDDEEE